MGRILHRKVSAKSDGGDATLILPSDWNSQQDDSIDVPDSTTVTVNSRCSYLVPSDCEIGTDGVLDLLDTSVMEIL
jgi:hypothetical protein